MCQSIIFKSPRCGCLWWRISEPCAPGMGFSTCARFHNGSCKGVPPGYLAWTEPCPKHDLRGFYDYNQTRMVVRVRNGLRWGVGPSVRDPGFDLTCGVM